MNNRPINIRIMGLEKQFYEPITTDKILDGAVTTPKIADSAITNDKLAEDSVDTSQLKNNSVTTEKIADSAVTNPKIADAAVITEKIKDGSITRNKLGSDFSFLGLRTIADTELDSTFSSGVYSVTSDDSQNMLLVSIKRDLALMVDEVCQIYIKSPSGQIMRRTAQVISGNPQWSEWEAVGETDLSEYIKNTDYATESNFGVVKIGTGIKSVNGVIQTDVASETLIMSRNPSGFINEVITPSNLNFAVKSALSDNNRISDMTDEEKANARGVIGALGASVLNDYYTKSQVDIKTSGTCKYKGRTDFLPSSTADVGDVWVKTTGEYGKFCGVNVVSVYAYGMGFDGEGGDMILSSASGFAVGKTYYVSTKNKKVLGTITPTGISGNTLSFTHQTNSDYYGVFCDIAEMKDSDYWNTWMGGNPVGIGETYYFYNADFDTAPPSNDTLNVTICEPNTPFVKTQTGWDALGGTVDFSDYYTRAQVDGKIAAAIESALNTEV